MELPQDYRNREQSYLKHRVLYEYLLLWGRKIGSLSQRGPMRLWYVDCFAGPWQNKNERLTDTSIHIGLSAMEDAATAWREKGHDIELKAVFVEKDRKPFQRLQAYLNSRTDDTIETRAFFGEFGSHTNQISELLANDPAFVFIDPTGFKGVAMDYLRPLMRPRMRDVLVNVMFNDINRFKDDPRGFLRQQMMDFFGTNGEVLSPGMTEHELLATYRRNLKKVCNLSYSADLAIPHPTHSRTWFRLVIGGKHKDVIDVFRRVEARIVGREASAVRIEARDRRTEERTGQLSLLNPEEGPDADPWYHDENNRDKAKIREILPEWLARNGPTPFGSLWPQILEEHHLTLSEFRQLVAAAEKGGELILSPPRQGRRTPRDEEIVSLAKL